MMNCISVVINYQTPALLKVAVRSFRKFYPSCPLLIVDNGSKDGSRSEIERLQSEEPDHTWTLFLPENIHHGPAMDHALRVVKEEFVFFLDSDTEAHGGGFLESMMNTLRSEESAYAAGVVQAVNHRGFRAEGGTPVVQSAYFMLKRSLYFKFPPFEHHGQPTLKNFSAATSQGYLLKDFPVCDYIHHLGRGTASRFGYALGWRGKLDFILNKLRL
jgi:GT2 family glycosyltransferase